MMFLLMAWTTTQGDWTVTLTGGPVWSYFSTLTTGGLVPYTYTYTTARFAGSLGWMAHSPGDTLEGRWRMDPAPSGISTLWLRYARGPFEMRAGDLSPEDWSLPLRHSRAQGAVTRFREPSLETEAVWFFPQGAIHLDRIQGENSQGPYRLSQAPVLPGSEEVFLVEEGVRKKLVRGEDYDVDYWVGEVVLLRRVLYPEDLLEVRYVVAGEGEGVQAGGVRMERGRLTFGGGVWQSYAPGGIREEPGGYVEAGLTFPHGEIRGQVVGMERQGVIYGSGETRFSSAGYEGEVSGTMRPRAVPLPGEGPIQVRERIHTRQEFRWGWLVAGGTWTRETGLQRLHSVEGWIAGRNEWGEIRLSGVRRVVDGWSFREGLRLEAREGATGVWVARYRGSYPARGIREGVWWEGGGEAEFPWNPVRAGFALHSEMQGSRHQETFQAYLGFQDFLTVRAEGRRTFEGLWIVTLSGRSNLQGRTAGVSLDVSRTFRSDRYLLASSSFWRAGGEGWIRWKCVESRVGGVYQQGERVMTDTGDVFSRTMQFWAAGRGRGRWGMVEGLASWNRAHTLIPLEGLVVNRGGSIRWEKSLGLSQIVAMGETGDGKGWSRGGLAQHRRYHRIEAGVDRQGRWIRQGVRGVRAESLVVDTARFLRSYTGVAFPTQVRWKRVDLRITPEAGRGSGEWKGEKGEGWIVHMEVRAGVAGRWGQVWGAVSEEMTTFGLYRLRRLQGGVNIRWGVLRAGGMATWERDLLRRGEYRSLNLQVGGAF